MLSMPKAANELLSLPVTALSVISYSVYLLHYSVVLQLMRYWVPSPEGAFASVAYTLGYLFLTLTLAYWLYRFFEKPLMDIRDRPFFSRFGPARSDKLIE